MENLILQKRKMVQDRIEKSFSSGLHISELQVVDINKSLDTDIEKAHNVGDVHPNGKWVWTEIRPGKFDWRVKKNSNNGSGGSTSTVNSSSGSGTGNAKSISASASKPTAQKKFDSDVVEHVNELVKKIGKDKALERFERYVKEYSDDGTKFGAMMKYKYSQAAEYLKGKTESDFKKTFKDARDEVLQQVVSGKIQASADEKKWAKDLLDERKATEDAAKDKNASDEKNHADVIAAHDGGKKKTESYASMDIKDAKKALVGKTVTLTDYWPDGRGGSQDAIGEIKNVRLYGKNKTPIAEVVYPNGDEQDIRLDEIDDGKMKDSYKTPITISDNKTAQKPKSAAKTFAAKTFAAKIMERAKDGRWFGSLSDDEKKKLEDNIKNDKASINDLLLAKFPAATAYSGFSSEEKSKIQLANGKWLKLVHSASIQSNRMGQEYTKHDYQITDLYGTVYGSSQSSQGYTTPAQAKRETINQALYALFAKK